MSALSHHEEWHQGITVNKNAVRESLWTRCRSFFIFRNFPRGIFQPNRLYSCLRQEMGSESRCHEEVFQKLQVLEIFLKIENLMLAMNHSFGPRYSIGGYIFRTISSKELNSQFLWSITKPNRENLKIVRLLLILIFRGNLWGRLSWNYLIV